MMFDKETSQSKVNFWLAWCIANAVGMGFAWPLGELIGRQVAQTSNWKTGQIVGIVVFESLLWAMRGTVLWRTRSFNPLKHIDTIIWVVVEYYGWIVSELPIQTDSPIAMTYGAIFATTLGAMMWIVIWFLTAVRGMNKFWALKAFLWTLFGFIVASIFVSVVLTASLEIAETLTALFFPLIGLSIAGLVFGGLLGAITGLVFVRKMHWQNQD